MRRDIIAVVIRTTKLHVSIKAKTTSNFYRTATGKYA